jgi:hypothetical protein
MGYNTESDFFTIVGKYVDGKLEYSYPRWMMMFNRIDFLPQNSKVVNEQYEIFNPAKIDLVENLQYSARVIHFDDGDIVEIIDKFEPNGAAQ